MEEQKGDWENNLIVLRKSFHSKKSGKVHCYLEIGKDQLERTENHRALCRRQSGAQNLGSEKHFCIWTLSPLKKTKQMNKQDKDTKNKLIVARELSGGRMGKR